MWAGHCSAENSIPNLRPTGQPTLGPPGKSYSMSYFCMNNKCCRFTTTRPCGPKVHCPAEARADSAKRNQAKEIRESH